MVFVQCDHPNVLGFLLGFVGPTNLWLVSEYCAGGSVGDVLSRKRAALGDRGHGNAELLLPQTVIGWIIAEALAGLDYLHTLHQCAHRDVKAANLLVALPNGVLACLLLRS
eukprot:SAG31_NODE_4935_length_2851_cov_2.089753_3_plen_111_part_00